MKEIGLYIHIPFCKRKCYYCDFCSFDTKKEKQNEYINSMKKEINNISDSEKYILKTIYIGGGTPSILDSEKIELILNEVKQKFRIKENAEITIEVNPGTATEEKLKKYKLIGINRLSIGLQSANDSILKSIGRIHNYNEFENTYNLARKIGFNNINVDLMIGLPNQNMNDIDETLEKIIQKNPEHISVYSLIIEDGTAIQKMVDSNKVILPDEETERKMYWYVKEKLENKGYNQYEISNFSKENYESKHNTDCWKQKEYIGIGMAAHSYLNKLRYSNICDIEKYIENIKNGDFKKNIVIHEKQDKLSEMDEYMILGLRMIKGINIKKFEEKFEEDPRKIYEEQLEKLKKYNLININKDSIKLTNKGLDFANLVWEKFIR